MAESVDALVSNTSGVIRAGSTPALGTQNGCQSFDFQLFLFYRGQIRYKQTTTPLLFEGCTGAVHCRAALLKWTAASGNFKYP